MVERALLVYDLGDIVSYTSVVGKGAVVSG